MLYVRTLPIIVFCFFTSVNGALLLASNFSNLLFTEFDANKLQLFPGTNKIMSDDGKSLSEIYDIDEIKLNCDMLQEHRLALREPGRHTTAVWEIVTTPESVREKLGIETWHKQFGTLDITYKLVNGTGFKKEMVYCPSMSYGFPGDVTYRQINGCYFAPSDIRKYVANGKTFCLANVFFTDPQSPSNVNYFGVDDEVRFNPK